MFNLFDTSCRFCASLMTVWCQPYRTTGQRGCEELGFSCFFDGRLAHLRRV